jgi:hypothetical protein
VHRLLAKWAREGRWGCVSAAGAATGVLAAVGAGLRTLLAEHGNAAIIRVLLTCRSAIETHDPKPWVIP